MVRTIAWVVCFLLIAVGAAHAVTPLPGFVMPLSSSLTSRFNAVETVDIGDISVASLHIDAHANSAATVVTLPTETAGPRVAKIEPSKSGAAATTDPAFSLPGANYEWRANLTGVENGYVNLDGTTRRDIPTPANLVAANGQLYHVTFYCACMECCGKTNAITASGQRAQAGVTVAAAGSIPFGTRIWIEGYGERVVQDRGGAIGLNRLDIYMNTHAEALAHGSRMIMIWFL